MPIEAVIFDYGKVLSNSEDPQAQQKLLALTGLERADFDRHYWAHRHAYDMGQLNGRTYWEQVANEAGLSFTPERIDSTSFATDVVMWTSLNEEMLGWVICLRGRGNQDRDSLQHGRGHPGLHAAGVRLAGHFQHHTWSCELGICKPDPAIYLHTCEKLKVQPPKALFLDDKPENIAAAAEVGLNAVLFENIEQLRADLQARGLQEGLPVPGVTMECEAEHLEKLDA